MSPNEFFASDRSSMRHSYVHHVKCGLGLITVWDVFVTAVAESPPELTVAELEDSAATVESDAHDGAMVQVMSSVILTETFSRRKRSVLLWNMCNSRTLIATTGSVGHVVLCLFWHRGFDLVASGAVLPKKDCPPRLTDTGAPELSSAISSAVSKCLILNAVAISGHQMALALMRQRQQQGPEKRLRKLVV
ncbi:unnamed protein product [Fusarium fujikuroi]|nr:unnamed protein product [Fusarium fujikuroi]